MTDLILYKDKELKKPYTIEDLGDVEAGNTTVMAVQTAILFATSAQQPLRVWRAVDLVATRTTVVRHGAILEPFDRINRPPGCAFSACGVR